MFLHAIGNSKLPRAMKSTPAYVLNGQWNFNSEAWIHEQVFYDWLIMDLNCSFHLKRKKIVLLVDNCPGHKIENIEHRFDYVCAIFLPPNITSLVMLRSFRPSNPHTDVRCYGN